MMITDLRKRENTLQASVVSLRCLPVPVSFFTFRPSVAQLLLFCFLSGTCLLVDMSECNAVPAAGPGDPLGGQTALGNGAGGIQKDAFADAVQRARLVRRREVTAELGEG